MKKFIFIFLLILLSVNSGYSNCAFGLCKVDKDSLGGIDTDIKVSITNLVLYFLTFLSLIAITFIIKGGFQILTAGGDEEKVKSGKKTILYALFGVFIIIIAYSIVNIGFTAGEKIEDLNKIKK